MRLAPSLTTPKAWEADLSFPVCASLKDNDWGPASKSPDPEDAEMISVFSDSDSELEAKKSRSSLWRRRRYSDDAPEGVLLRALKALSFEGAFLQTQRYPVAQVSNPCLEIDGIGLVGLPLSPPFAQALLGERRCSARLEIPAEELRFTNPEWDAWLHKEARTICTDLSGKKNKPMYRLKKLVLEGSNAQAAESPSSEEAIATLVVFLPSAFEGGDILFEHGVQSATVRLGPQSHLFTSLVAAYSIVNTNLSLITSGYRLSLHYEVLDLAPFPDTDGPVRVLLEALVDWKETKRPSVLAYFMRRQYPLADDFTLQALAGSDALLMAHLQRMASELDFHLYVVQVQHSAYSYGDYDGPLDPVIPSEIENAEGVEEYWPSETQVNAFDMNSVPVDVEGFDFTDKSGSEYLNGELWDVEPKIEYETEYHPKILIKQTWNRTLFLLWPASDDAKVQPVKVRYSAEYARAALCSAGSFNPSRLRDKVLAKSLQESCRTGEERRDSVRELCKVAEARADGQMFLRILSAYDVAKNVDLIGLEMCVSAYRKFGWEVLKDFFCDAVQKDVSNPRRQQLVEQLHHVATRQSDSVVATWAEEQQDLMPRSLNRVSDNEIDWLLDLTVSHDFEFMRTILYPQLKTQRLPSAFWVRFIHKLKVHATAKKLGSVFVNECVPLAADNLFVVPGDKRAGEIWSYDDTASSEARKCGLITEVLRLCVEAGNTTSFPSIFGRMKRAAEEGMLTSTCASWECYVELARSLDAYLSILPHAEAVASEFRGFFRNAVECMLSSSTPLVVGKKKYDGFAFVAANLTSLDVAISRAGGAGFLGECDIPMLLAGRDFSSLQTLVTHLVARFRPSATDLTLLRLVHQCIDVFDTKTFREVDPAQKHERDVSEVVDMVQFCDTVGVRSAWPRLLDHLEAIPAGVSSARYVSHVLAPVIPLLRAYLQTHGLDLSSAPFASFTANVVKSFGTTVMNQQVGELGASIKLGCNPIWSTCKLCDSLREFFVSDEETVCFTRRGSDSDHLVKELKVTKAWGVTVKVSKVMSNMSAVEVTKPANMTQGGMDVENTECGMALLASLGDTAAQQLILGSDYNAVVDQISRRGGTLKRVAPAKRVAPENASRYPIRNKRTKGA